MPQSLSPVEGSRKGAKLPSPPANPRSNRTRWCCLLGGREVRAQPRVGARPACVRLLWLQTSASSRLATPGGSLCEGKVWSLRWSANGSGLASSGLCPPRIL